VLDAIRTGVALDWGLSDIAEIKVMGDYAPTKIIGIVSDEQVLEASRSQVEKLEMATPWELVLGLDEQGKQEKIAWLNASQATCEVLKLAEGIIRRDRPVLTLDIHRSPEDFFAIPALLRQWVPEYKLLLRDCECNPQEQCRATVLIAYVE